ncbi:unnamed protein product [Closterium sp. NIES-64]|nr:unnamed protein product [Closterium sp. NIES-64]
MKLSHWSSAARMLQTPTQQVTLSGAGTPLRFFFRWPWVCSLLPCLNQWLPLSSLALHFKSQFPLQLAPTTALSLALCVRIAGGGEGCGVNTDAPSRPSPVAVQGGGTWMRAAGGGAAAALSSPSRYQLSHPPPCPHPCPPHHGLSPSQVQVPLSGAGPPLRCRSPSQVQVPLSGAGPPLRCRSPSQVQVPLSGAGPPLRCRSPSQVQVPLSGAGPPLRCRSPSQVQVPLSGAGPPLRCRFPSQVQVPLSGAGSPLRCRFPSQVQVPLASVAWRGGALGSTPTLPRAPPLWPCRDLWGPEGGSTAAWQSHYSKGEYRDGLGLSRSLAMQQRQLTGPVVAASAAGSADAAGEGRGEGDIRRHLLALLQLPAKWRGGALGSTPALTRASPWLQQPRQWRCQQQQQQQQRGGGSSSRSGGEGGAEVNIFSCQLSAFSSLVSPLLSALSSRCSLNHFRMCFHLFSLRTRHWLGPGGGRGVWVDANTPPRPSLLAVQAEAPCLDHSGVSPSPNPPSLSTSQQPHHHAALHGCGRYRIDKQVLDFCGGGGGAAAATAAAGPPRRLDELVNMGGLPEDLRDQLSVVVIAPRDLADSDDQCPICLTDYEVHDVQQRQPCGHHFHQPCLDAWFTSHTTCPVCRVQLTLQPDNPEKDQQGAGTSAVGVAVPGSIT